MELTKFIIIIILAIITIIGFIFAVINMTISRRKDKELKEKEKAQQRRELDEAIANVSKHADEEDRKLNEKICKSLDDILIEIDSMKQCITRLQVQSDLWWDNVRHKVLDTLKTMPTEAPRDALIEDLKRDQISLDDAKILRELFFHEAFLPDNQNKLWAYSQAITLLDITIHNLRKETLKNGQYTDGDSIIGVTDR